MKNKKNPRITLDEAKRLLSLWTNASFPTRAASVRYHARKHGDAADVWKYLRQAATFKKRGARRRRDQSGTTRYVRANGEFLTLRSGKIVTYGVN